MQTLPHITEYGSETFRANKATVEVIRKETRKNEYYGTAREWTLTHVTPGYVPAGSCARLQESEIWKVTAWIDNAIHGQGFLRLEDAETCLSLKGELV